MLLFDPSFHAFECWKETQRNETSIIDNVNGAAVKCMRTRDKRSDSPPSFQTRSVVSVNPLPYLIYEWSYSTGLAGCYESTSMLSMPNEHAKAKLILQCDRSLGIPDQRSSLCSKRGGNASMQNMLAEKAGQGKPAGFPHEEIQKSV